MRSVVVVISLAIVPAHADTPRQPEPKAAPAPAPAPAPKVVVPERPTGGPSFGGGHSAGIVVVPAPHPDDQPWPEGMIIKPPDVNDPIAIAPGADGLSPGTPVAPSTWTKRFTDAIQGGIDAVFELVLPNSM
jgi:hypothetical protein